MRYPIVLFDLDHTLMDSDASSAAAFDATMRSIDVDPTAEVFAIYDRLNQALWRRVEAGEISPNEVKVRRFEQLLGELGVAGDPDLMGATFVQALTDHGGLYDGALELLDALAGSVRMAMVTNGIGPVQRGRIERLGISSYFEVLSISGELHTSKPGAQIFDHTLAEMGVTDRSTVVMIGDSLASDIAGGINAGIDTIWFDQHGTEDGRGAATHEASSLHSVGAHLFG